MKKYLFGILAIVIAVGMVAFTTPKKAAFTDYYFGYTLGTFTETQVENPANWTLVSDIGNESPFPTCSGSDVKACRIRVPEGVTKLVNNVRVLQVSGDTDPADIIAAQSSTNVFYVTVAGDVLEKRNKD